MINYLGPEDDNKLKIYYEWCHQNPIIERLISKNDINRKFTSIGWKLKTYDFHVLDSTDSDWNNYFKCFSTLVFIKI